MDLTALLHAWKHGDPEVVNQIMEVTYAELRVLAQACLSGKGARVSLAATAMVHEAYLRLVDKKNLSVHDRGHFFALAANVLRGILVNHLQAAHAEKRGGKMQRITLSGCAELGIPEPDVLALHQALARLEKIHPQQARIVELKFFAGLSMTEIAEILDLAERGLYRQYEQARVWLYRYMKKSGS